MKLEKLEKDNYYHIYNRGINSCHIFKSNENKNYLLKLIHKYLSDKVSILAYCLMDNHFHLVIQVIEDERIVTQAFSNLFNAYAKAFNKMYDRTGSLFEKHFRRIKIKDTNYLRNLIIYVNTNPENHGIINDFRMFTHSSYQDTISITNNLDLLLIAKEEVLALFEDSDNFEYLHQQKRNIIINRLDLD